MRLGLMRWRKDREVGVAAEGASDERKEEREKRERKGKEAGR